MLGDQRLVGRHHVLPGIECRFHTSPRRPLVTADQLNDDIDLRIFRKRHRIVEPAITRKVHAAVLRPVPSAHRCNLQRARQPGIEPVAMRVEQFKEAGPDGAKPGDAQ